MKIKIIYLCLFCFILIACINNGEQTFTVLTNTEQPKPIKSHTPTQNPTITDEWELSPTVEMAFIGTPEPAPIPSYKPQAWTIYSIAEIGLSPPVSKFPELEIYDIEEDQSGGMWFATSFGLIRFDGYEWKLEEKEISKNHVKFAYVDISTEDEIWFTLSDGIYALKEGVIQKRISFVDFGVDISDLGGLEITMDGMVWIQLANDIWYFDGDEWVILKSENELPFIHVGGLAIDKHGRLYTWGNTGKDGNSGSYYGGLALYVNDNWVIYDQKEQYGIPSNDMTPSGGGCLTIDDQDHVWFYLWREGLFEYAEGKFTLHVPYDNDRYHPTDMVFDQGGTLWLGDWSEVAPLAKYVSGSDTLQFIDDSSTFYVYDEDDEDQEYPISRNKSEGILPFEHVSALYVDSSNDLWIATELGIYVYDLNYIY